MIKVIKNKNNQALLFILLSIYSSVTFASLRTWSPVISLGAGFLSTSNVGQSQNFPILNPVTDEFYNYSATQFNQRSDLFEGFLGTEWCFQPNWAIQVGLDYNRPTSSFAANGTFLQGADLESADSYTYQYRVATSQWLIAGKLLYSLKNTPLHPYLLGGLGVAYNKAYDYGTNVPPFLTFTRMYANNTSKSFSYALGVGVDADIAPRFRLGMGYRFSDLGKIRLGAATIDTTPVEGTLSQAHWYANEFLAQLTWII